MSTLKLISWNVNGIRAIMKKGFMDFVNESKADIICIQETKVDHNKYQINLNGYLQYWNSAKKSGYAGTAIFTKQKPLNYYLGIDKKQHDDEGRIITLEFDNFYLVNAYIPNSGRGLPRLDYRKEWDKDFLNFLKKLDEKKPVILCGDLNVAHTEIDLANPKSNYNKTAGYTQDEIDGFNSLLNASFVDTFRIFNKESGNYTYWGMWNNLRQRNIGWRIDYFVVSKRFAKHIGKSVILKDVTGSDHCPVELDLKI